jgi:hypothetical protein
MKHNYNRHVERMENWKDIEEEEDWASKVGLVLLFLKSWEAPMLNVMLEVFNTFVIKGTYIYFGHQDKVYVINKQLIVHVFGVCVEGYVEDPKGYVNKSLTIHALQSCRITLVNSTTDQWNEKNLGLPYFVRYPVIIYVIYQREKVFYFSNMNAITLLRAKKG